MRDGGRHKTAGESLRRDFLRHKVGFAKHTPLLAIRENTGFRPFYIDALTRALNYWEGLNEEKRDSLIGLAIRTEQELWTEGWKGWYLGIPNLEKVLGQGKQGTCWNPLMVEQWK